MKKDLGIILIFWMFCQICTASFTDSADQTVPANIFFFRLPNFIGSAAKMTIVSNSQPIARLKNASYIKYVTQPGDYIFSLGLGSLTKIKLSIESGKDYYIKCYYNMGFWSGIPILELVDAVSGKSSIDANQLSEQSVEPIFMKERKSRIGLLLNGGFGFESYPWFVDENGDDVKLSTGGGFGIGAEYGHKFGRNFDLSFNCFFQGSGLSRTLKNASGSFNRLDIIITPALVIPVRGGEILRFKIGAGPGLYSLGTMKIDASEITGDKYTFKYKSALGMHGLFLFESNFMERGSMNLGVRYSNIHYKFNPSGSSDNVTEPKLVKPDGSGIDFIFGYNFLF